MATEYRQFSVTIPPGTAQTAGFTADLSFPSRIVTQINVRIPPGPRGEVGIGIGNSGVITIPFGNSSYIVTDDEDLQFPLDQAVESGAWTFFGYNTGQYQHTIKITFYLEPIPAAPSLAGGTVPITSTGTGTDTGTTTDTGGIPGGCVDQYGNIVDCPPGVPAGTIIPVPTVPPVTVPPPPPPPALPPAPVILPPITALPPGLGGPPPYDSGDPLLVAVPDITQVWLLDAELYRNITSQDDANALLDAGIVAVTVSTATHQSILGESVGYLSVSLGDEVLGGTLTYQR